MQRPKHTRPTSEQHTGYAIRSFPSFTIRFKSPTFVTRPTPASGWTAAAGVAAAEAAQLRCCTWSKEWVQSAKPSLVGITFFAYSADQPQRRRCTVCNKELAAHQVYGMAVQSTSHSPPITCALSTATTFVRAGAWAGQRWHSLDPPCGEAVPTEPL